MSTAAPSTLTATSIIAIVGAGQAGVSVASELRRLGFDGRVLLVGEEAHPPYKRPPLSKTYLAGEASATSLAVLTPEALEKQKLEWRGGTRVTRIERETRQLVLADGARVGYDRLVLATGGRARTLPVAGAQHPCVHTLRTVDDVNSIRAALTTAQHVTVVGGGFIGLETAAVLRKQGLQVCVLEALPQLLARVTSPLVGEFYAQVHRSAGVDLRLSTQLAAIDDEGGRPVAVLADGARLATDLIIVGIGIVPNVELAAHAGLEVGNGIVVDAGACTTDPTIYAAGDCTLHPSRCAGRPIRLESVQNALEQARIVAQNLLGGSAEYQTVPWFWSDQYDLKLQMVGLSGGHDQQVLRGDPQTRSFMVFYFREGRLIAADAVNRAADFGVARKLVSAGASLDPATLADETVDLKSLAG